MRTRERVILEEVGLLEKSQGEGSRGGHVTGHTKSGKPIYEDNHEIGSTESGKPIYARHDHPDHSHFTRKDHSDAVRAHHSQAFYNIPAEHKAYHEEQAKHHDRLMREKVMDEIFAKKLEQGRSHANRFARGRDYERRYRRY